VSGTGRIWGLRFLALAIALALWFVLSFERREETSEKVVDASVSYLRPDDLTILDQRQTVEVTLSGPRDAVNRVTPADVSAQVDVRGARPGPLTVSLTPQNITLPSGLRVQSIAPASFTLHIDRQVTRRIPVEPQLTGEPAAGAMVGDVEVLPPQVDVVGPQSQVDELESLPTSPVRLDGHALSFEEVVAVVVPEDVTVRQVEPSRVTVRVPLRVTRPRGEGAGDGS